MLRLDLRPGEGVDIENGRIVIRLEQKSGQICRLAVEAAKDIPIKRVERVQSPAQIASMGLTR